MLHNWVAVLGIVSQLQDATTDSTTSIHSTFPPPAGFVAAERTPYGDWLGALSVAAPDVPVRTHDGRTVPINARVVPVPMVKGDLQQCADMAIRLRAEWLRETHAPDIVFHATNGQALPWSRWERGEHTQLVGNRLVWRVDNDKRRAGWDGWLREVFLYAGTLSLVAYETFPVDAPQAGDVIVVGGSPGHAVVVLDVAHKRGAAGVETIVLVGEGFMPAMDFHVPLGPLAGWWPWTDEGIALPHWPLPEDALRRWR